ncbi:TRAP transporter large permease [Marinobacter sp. 71-i]|uniref:TRAP transporter large permease protein n=1 Tax=Marinobacter iranensis TaxID=2962607 RepID=A0ABT5YAY1_9GAMM|nr:TRAP transporter large permease [Marinobacter iranensis]MDF0750841.1 TRAP transporter large permease [Marinobacter iranensis]
MTHIEIGGLIIALLFTLLILGMPIAFSLLTSGMVGIFLTRGSAGFEYLISTFPYSHVSNFAYVVIPLFLLMSHMAFATGVSARAFEAANKFTAGLQGGLAVATIFACAIFSTVSGSSIATAAAIAKVAIPEMRAAGYSDKLAAGCVAVGGTLGVLIPPSSILIIYGLATGTSIVQLFTGALLPGALTAVAYVLGIVVMGRLNPLSVGGQKDHPRFNITDRFKGLLLTWEALVLFVLVVGSIYLGIATPNEAAAVGAFVAIIMAMARRGRFNILWHGLRESSAITSSVFALIIGAGMFSLALTTTRLPVEIAVWVSSLDVPIPVLLILILLPFLVLGAFIDGISMILLMMPIVFPIIEQVGVHPVLFGVLVVKVVEIGLITPPVGLNVFVVKGAVSDLDLKHVFLGCLPFLAIELMLIVLLISVPQLVLWPLG